MIIEADHLEASTMKTGSKLAIVLFVLSAIGHLLRLIVGVPMTVGEWGVPHWISAFGVIVPAIVAYLLWKEGK